MIDIKGLVRDGTMVINPIALFFALFVTFFSFNSVIYGIRRLRGEFAYSFNEYVIIGILYLTRGKKGVKAFKEKDAKRINWNRYQGIIHLICSPIILYYAAILWAMTFSP